MSAGGYLQPREENANVLAGNLIEVAVEALLKKPKAIAKVVQVNLGQAFCRFAVQEFPNGI